MARKDHIPLSFAQARLWFLDQLLPNVALYNIPISLKLNGNLKTFALEKAFNVLIERHESLRTIFLATEGEAYQAILPKLVIDLVSCLIDLTSLKGTKREAAVKRLVQEETNTQFNLSVGPLIRIKLIILSKEEHILLITMHHIISDAWSIGVLFKELSALYNAYIEGEDSSFSTLTIQYADLLSGNETGFKGKFLNNNFLIGSSNLQEFLIFLHYLLINLDLKNSLIKGLLIILTSQKKLKINSINWLKSTKLLYLWHS